jgi:hypothetical protein
MRVVAGEISWRLSSMAHTRLPEDSLAVIPKGKMDAASGSNRAAHPISAIIGVHVR